MAGSTRSPPILIKPQLAALVKTAPDGPDWLHEIKFDGYRMHARLDAAHVQILTRRGNIWTDKYPAIAKAIAALPAKNAYLDASCAACCKTAERHSTSSRMPATRARDRSSSSYSICCSSRARTSPDCPWSTARPG
jgi:ATP-dependent DNA ligase